MAKKAEKATKLHKSTREPHWVKGFLASIRLKANVTRACIDVKIDRGTAYDRRNDYPDFAKAWDDAMEEGADRLEEEAWRRAVYGTDKPVFYEGTVCGHVREYSDTLMCLLLKGHKPAKFRERISQENTFPDGIPLVQIHLPDNGRSDNAH